jgi:hypothetical protein
MELTTTGGTVASLPYPTVIRIKQSMHPHPGLISKGRGWWPETYRSAADFNADTFVPEECGRNICRLPNLPKKGPEIPQIR